MTRWNRWYAGAPAAAFLTVLLTAGLAVAASPARRATQLQLGVTVFTMWRDWEDHAALLARADASGVGWLRVDVGWCSLEEAGAEQVSQWYRGRLDTTVATARRLGLRVLVQLGCAPKWAGGTGFNSYPRDPAQFQRVARYLAQRYRGKVAAWEIWNEPDCIGGCGNGSARQFVRVLKAGYRGVKAGDPGAVVVSGGTSGNDVDWVSKMYAEGGRGFFDALAVHPYEDPASTPPDAPSEGNKYRLTSIALVHAVMSRHDDARKPIWLTEFGWTTAQNGPKPGVDPPTQARYLTQAIDQINHDYPYVTHAFWYCLRDRDDSTPYENNFGLLDTSGNPKPAYTALRQASRALSGPVAGAVR